MAPMTRNALPKRHQPAPCQFGVQCFEYWRSAMATGFILLGVILMAWQWAAQGWSAWVWLVWWGSLVAGLVSCLTLAAQPAFSLRWDGQAWWLGQLQERGHEPCEGHLTVVIDLGFWVLLRFSCLNPTGRWRWLPIQKRGHESFWSVLRVTLYGANPNGI
jgi:hypothetical protein